MRVIFLFLLVIFSRHSFAQEQFQLAPPLLKYNSIFFSKSAQVTILFAQKGATIHYTLDGKEPVESSLLYKTPLILNRPFTTVKVKAFASGFRPSDVTTVSFIKSGLDYKIKDQSAASDKYKAAHLTFLTADASATPLPAYSFDLLVSFETLEHLEEHERLLEEFKRLLKPGGLMIISTPDKEMYSDKTGYRNPFHKKELNRPEFELLLQKYFKHVRILTQETCHSSLIINTGQSRFDIYNGDQQQLEKNKPSTGLYLVAFASAEALPEINSSVFNGRSVLQQALDEQERMLRQTVSYRVGHLLLSPFKWFKKLFK